MTFTCASLTIDNGIADLVLTPTGKANRMGPDYWSQMPELMAQLSADDSVRVIVIRGGADNFSSGLDLVAMAADLGQLLDPQLSAGQRSKLLELIRRMQNANTAVARCKKPVIAAVHGWCVGGGIDLITACDIRLAATNARFSVREVRLAIVADVGTLARLPPIVGQGVARELCFTGDDFDAQRALRIGLVNELYETPDALFAAARAMATRIAKNSPLATQGTKQVLNFTSERDAALGLEGVAMWNAAFLPSKDVGEAIAAMLEKREANFTGE